MASKFLLHPSFWDLQYFFLGFDGLLSTNSTNLLGSASSGGSLFGGGGAPAGLHFSGLVCKKTCASFFSRTLPDKIETNVSA